MSYTIKKGNKKAPSRLSAEALLSMVPGAGIEPARLLRSRDFKLHVVCAL